MLFVLSILLASAWSQEDDAPTARKSSLYARRPAGGRALGRGPSSTTTAATAPVSEEILESEDENVEENNAAVAEEDGYY